MFNFRFYEILVDHNILTDDTIINTNTNNVNNVFNESEKQKRKKNYKLTAINTEYNNFIEKLKNYSKDYQKEIQNTLAEVSNIETKKNFYSPEASFEEVNINENFNNKNYYISTRNRTNLNNTNSNNITRLSSNTHRNRNIPFDFHIKNGDENSYEKLVID
jgi:hypothetical protein